MPIGVGLPQGRQRRKETVPDGPSLFARSPLAAERVRPAPERPYAPVPPATRGESTSDGWASRTLQVELFELLGRELDRAARVSPVPSADRNAQLTAQSSAIAVRALEVSAVRPVRRLFLGRVGGHVGRARATRCGDVGEAK